MPAGKSDISKSYGDIWQLVVDVPGGLFEGAVDWEGREAHGTARTLADVLSLQSCGFAKKVCRYVRRVILLLLVISIYRCH